MSKINLYKLLNANSLDRNTLERESINVTITSPPYNVGVSYKGGSQDDVSYDEYLNFSKEYLSNILYWTKPTGRLCLNVGLDKNKNGKRPICSDITKLAMDMGWKYHSTIIWNEGTVSRRTAWGSWLSASAPHVIAPVEVILVLYKDEWKRDYKGTSTIQRDDFIKWTNGLWIFGGSRKNGHPAPFPPELPRRCIQLFSYLEDTILDPFSGSGTTVLESISNGRKAIGVEISKEYHKLAKERIESSQCQLKLPNVT